jgi:hypothetical protein
MRGHTVLTLVAIGVLLWAPSDNAWAQVQGRAMGGVGLMVFEDPNYRGRNATLRDNVPNLQSMGMNDRISSLRAAPGESWEVCEHANYQGRCQVFSGSEPNLRNRGWNDMISSARRVSGPGGGGGYYPPVGPGPYPPTMPPGAGRGATLFTGTNFSGRQQSFTGPVPDLRRLGFNDLAQSLRLPPGQSWEVCQDSNYRNCRVVNRDWGNLAQLGMNRRISSLRPWTGGGAGPWQPPAAAPPVLVLYDGVNLRGEAFTVNTALNRLGRFDRRADSLQVRNGVWEVCDNTNFRGRCVTIDRDVFDLQQYGLRGRVRSARPLTGRY